MSRVLNLAIAVLLLVAFVFTATAGASAPEPDAASIVKRMKQALEPARPSVRVMTLKVSSSEGFAAQWTRGQARAHVNDTDWILTAVLKPADARGITFLAKKNPARPPSNTRIGRRFAACARSRPWPATSRSSEPTSPTRI